MVVISHNHTRDIRALPFSAEPRFAATAYFLVLLLCVTALALALDTRQFQGENVWLKPIKFEIALIVYLLTLAYFARWLPGGLLASRWYRLFSAVVVFCVIGEMAWIGGAAMFQVASHYNVASAIMGALYSLMGVFAAILTAASLVFGIAFWRYGHANLSEPLRLSIALGLVLTFVLTLIVAGTLASFPGHFVGTPETGAQVAVMGWSREVGDLRVGHFLATHALQVLPIVGIIAALAMSESGGKLVVWGAAVAYAALVGFTYLQALNGEPFIPL